MFNNNDSNKTLDGSPSNLPFGSPMSTPPASPIHEGFGSLIDASPGSPTHTPPSSPTSEASSSPSKSGNKRILEEEVPQVIDFIKTSLSGFDFHFSGSIALHFWANEYGQSINRDLGDIDIVTKEPLIRFQKLIKSTSVPGVESRYISGRLGKFSIDVISADKGVGSLDGACTLQNGVNVVSLESLKKFKTRQMEDDSFIGHLTAKHTTDLELIELLLKLQKERNAGKWKETASHLLEGAGRKRVFEDRSSDNKQPDFKRNRFGRSEGAERNSDEQKSSEKRELDFGGL